MGYKKATLILLLAILLLVACSPYPKLRVESNVSKVEVSYFETFGSMNEDYHISFEKKADIKVFINAINTSKPVNGDVDMPEGDYDFRLTYNNGTSGDFHLWVSNEFSYGTIMTTDETASAHTLTKKATKRLKSLLEK